MTAETTERRTHNERLCTGRHCAECTPATPLPDYRPRSWEPAARHYRDLTDDERKEYGA